MTIRNPVDEADTDTTLQQFVHMLTTFDNAVAEADFTEAERIFGDLRGIAGTDERFNESIRSAQARLKWRTGNTAPAADSGPISVSSRISRADVAQNESPASSDGSLTRWIRQTVSATGRNSAAV